MSDLLVTPTWLKCRRLSIEFTCSHDNSCMMLPLPLPCLPTHTIMHSVNTHLARINMPTLISLTIISIQERSVLTPVNTGFYLKYILSLFSRNCTTENHYINNLHHILHCINRSVIVVSS